MYSPVNLMSQEKPRNSASSTHALSDLDRFTLVWRIWQFSTVDSPPKINYQTTTLVTLVHRMLHQKGASHIYVGHAGARLASYYTEEMFSRLGEFIQTKCMYWDSDINIDITKQERIILYFS
jgi:hypothetical protein